MPNTTPRKEKVSYIRRRQRAHSKEGLCVHCGTRKMVRSDLCFRHHLFRKLVTAGIRGRVLSAADKLRREHLAIKLGIRYNAIKAGTLRPAGGVDERVLRNDLKWILEGLGMLTIRDRKPAISWGGHRGYHKLLGIVRRLDKRAWREKQRDE